MSSQVNARVVREFNDAYNRRDWDAAINMCTSDITITNVATGQTFRGADGIRQFLMGWANAFPDSKVETTDVVADDQGAVIEFRGRGTQTGPLQGPSGDVPPTNRSVDVPFIQVCKISNGKITEGRLYFDNATMMQQLGLMPQMERARG